jgi:hypothetical protein
MSEAALMLYTGGPGSGKTFFLMSKLTKEVFPYYKNIKVVTNVPMLCYPDRVEVRDFEAGWEPEGEDFEDKCERLRDTYVIIDEAQEVITSKNAELLVKMIGKARKRSTMWVYISQSKENFPKAFQDLCTLWVECYKGEDLRDPVYGFRIGDIQNLRAKLTGKFVEFFQRIEYRWFSRRWVPIEKTPYRQWFDPAVGATYDTKQGHDVDEDGRPKVTHDYQRFGLFTLLKIIAIRNAHCVPRFLWKNGLPLGFIAVGCVSFWWLNPAAKLKPKPEVVSVEQRAGSAKSNPVSLGTVKGDKPAAAVVPVLVKPGVPRKVLVWLLLLAGMLPACKTVTPPAPGPSAVAAHVDRTRPGREPKVAAFGAGHSLDALLGAAGLESQTGLTVDGPLVGREVLDKAREAGFGLQGDKLVPARKRAVAVPSELTSENGTVTVGGFKVKLADEADVERWRELSSVVHEAYQTELLIVAVESTSSRQLSAIASGTGNISLSYPRQVAADGRLSVAMSANGSVVYGREIARPLLSSAPGSSADVHVGQRIPVKLSSSSSSVGGQTQTIGSTLQYVQTGTQVTIKPERVSASQVRLAGKCSISQQTASVDGVPVTSERSLSIDHLCTLDQWTLLGRLDSASYKKSRGYFAIGSFLATGDETFLVMGKCVQVHRDERMHGPEVKADVEEQVEVKDLTSTLPPAPAVVVPGVVKGDKPADVPVKPLIAENRDKPAKAGVSAETSKNGSPGSPQTSAKPVP